MFTVTWKFKIQSLGKLNEKFSQDKKKPTEFWKYVLNANHQIQTDFINLSSVISSKV